MIALLKSLNAYADVVKVSNSPKLRRGPLVVYNEDNGIVKAFRNLPGVELVNVRRLNLLQLAPGGHLGRFVIWTEVAFTLLDDVYGTFEKAALYKKDYLLTTKITNPATTRLINLDEIQSVVRSVGQKVQKCPWTRLLTRPFSSASTRTRRPSVARNSVCLSSHIFSN